MTAALAQLFAKGAHQLKLRHGTAQTAQRSLDFAQVPNFLAQLHNFRPCGVFQYEIFILQFAIIVKICIVRLFNGLQAVGYDLMGGYGLIA